MTNLFSPIPSNVLTPAPPCKRGLTRTELSSCGGISSFSLKPAARTSLELTIMATGGSFGLASLAGSHSTKVRPEASLGSRFSQRFTTSASLPSSKRVPYRVSED
uniref:Uncharacterized protein n=1 Tax=Haptolina brevifila TaxID=156173 RepID=A0A7S2IA45_9EUKA